MDIVFEEEQSVRRTAYCGESLNLHTEAIVTLRKEKIRRPYNIREKYRGESLNLHTEEIIALRKRLDSE